MTNFNLSRPILVEFVGAAGAGKSFCTASVCDELARREFPVENFKKVQISKLNIRNIWMYIFASVAALTLLPRKFTLYRISVKHLARYKIRRAAIRQHGCVYVSDEGIFQVFRALHRNSRSTDMEEVADRLAGLVNIPDIVVVIEAAVETVFARRTDRNRPNDEFDWDSVTRDVTMIKDTVRVVRHVQRYSEAGLQFILADVNGADVTSMVEEVANLVELLVTCETGKN